MVENNSTEDELYPPIWFSFWSPQTLKEVLPVKGGGGGGERGDVIFQSGNKYLEPVSFSAHYEST